MLKALELIGFKSFADKTRFEFPPGITVVVGPNGSGKSNIVDGIKWVLGEQSAKSLRGKDMADVIFKGSGSGRKVMNTAEATIIIDNSEGRLPVDAPEVHVTRRVYRSGEGEYLINGQGCRLKDVRDMFRGTGVGTDAYSLIEQGKVDRLLQASPRDRRAIFEEAAGISRFKAKKVEAQRRLARVEQNLLRLSDIVDEVDSRLRSVRNQAGKARRYREYSDRLQQLRTQVGLADWRQLTEKLEHVQAQLSEIQNQSGELGAEVESLEAQGLALETQMLQTGDAIRDCEQRAARNGERLATRLSTVEHQRALSGDLEDGEQRFRQQLAILSTRAGDVEQKAKATAADFAEATGVFESIQAEAERLEVELSELDEQLDRLRRRCEQQRHRYVDRMRSAATLGNEVSQLQVHLAGNESAAERAREQAVASRRQADIESAELNESRAAEAALAARRQLLAEEQAEAERRRDDTRRQLTRRQEELAIQQGRFSGVSERTNVLEELEARKDGLNRGVQEVLTLARDTHSGPWAEVAGVVADLIRADVQVAQQVDIALGESAQYVVLDGHHCLDDLRQHSFRPQGRVGFITADGRYADEATPDDESVDATATNMPAPIDEGPRETAESPLVETPDAPIAPPAARLVGRGILGRADEMIECDAQHRPVMARLLGQTWLVDSLDTALHWSTTDSGRGQRFVTKAGELVSEHGAVVVGPPDSGAGLVSRRSQLRSLRRELVVLQERIREARQEMERLQENIDSQDQVVHGLAARQHELVAQLADQRVRTRGWEQQCEQLRQLEAGAEAEYRTALDHGATAAEQLGTKAAELDRCEAELAETETALRADEAELESLEQRRQQRIQDATAARIEWAKAEQQVAALRQQLDRFEEDQRERSRSLEEARHQLAESRQRRQVADRSILAATSELAELYLLKESLVRESERLTRRRGEASQQRAELSTRVQKLRQQLRKLEAEQHQHELAAGQMQHERTTLVERLREDYGIEIANYEAETSEEAQQQREEVEQEIASLRRKINNLGAVNMEALNELDDLEARHGSLDAQFRDLTAAKESLERIIVKINADSRRLFSETLEAIRTNFQSLYRKAFGGGRADIVLEEGVDILECGVEIIATPPGKPSFNNSLLSGGEKALTAVALLLAIFQFRPSPFCVLDEVDAPFDEANIGRFVDVLREFLGWTKFVVVTHSKKTMTAATTLYGVTMQESGVSKQVSVRFEDVTEDGHILPEALEREAETSDDERAA